MHSDIFSFHSSSECEALNWHQWQCASKNKSQDDSVQQWLVRLLYNKEGWLDCNLGPSFCSFHDFLQPVWLLCLPSFLSLTPFTGDGLIFFLFFVFLHWPKATCPGWRCCDTHDTGSKNEKGERERKTAQPIWGQHKHKALKHTCQSNILLPPRVNRCSFSCFSVWQMKTEHTCRDFFFYYLRLQRVKRDNW